MSLARATRLPILLLAALLALLGMSPAGAAQAQLRIGVLAIRSLETEQRHWAHLAAYLQARMPDVQVSVTAYDHDALSAAVAARAVEIVITSPADYLDYVQRLGLGAPLAGLVVESRIDGHRIGSRQFGGTVVVRADNRHVQRLDDLVGARIAVPQASATGGYQAPLYALLKRGIDLRRQAHLEELGPPYEGIARALLDGKVDAGFLRSGVLEGLIADGIVPTGALRVIEPRRLPDFPFAVSTPLYPERPVAAMPQLPEKVAVAATGALLELSGHDEVTHAIGIYGFTLPYYYDPVRDMLRALRLPPYEHQPLISFRDVWRDHSPLVIGFGLGLLLIVSLTAWQAMTLVRLRDARERLTANSAALSLQSRRLRALIDGAPELIWLKDQDGVFRLCNPSFEPYTGRHESDLVGHTDFDVLDADTARRFRAADRDTIALGRSTEQEEWLARKDGSYTGLFQVVRTPVWDGQRRLMGVLGMARDITELRETRLALGERVKEQNCLHTVFRLTENHDLPLPEVLQGVADALPSGWMYPENASACVELDGARYLTPGYVDGLVEQGAPVLVGGELRGRVAVAYRNPQPPQDEGPFLREERVLLEAIVERLGSVLQHRAVLAEARRREELIRAIFADASDAITLVDNETLKFVEFNTSAHQGLGYSREEFARLRLTDVQGQYNEAVIRQLHRDFAAAGGGHLDTLRRHKNGSLLNVRVSVKPLRLHGRDYTTIIWADMTESVRVQRQLAAESERLQNIIDATHAGTWEWNLDTGEAVFNERWAEIFGYQLRELEPFTTDSWERFVHPDDLRRANHLMARHLAGELPYYECDVRMRHKQGRWVWILNRGRVTRRDPGGRPVIVSGTHVDITERHEAEDRLRESEEMIRLLLASTSYGVLGVDMDDRITFVNAAAAALLGYREEEMIGTLSHALIHAPCREAGQACRIVTTLDDGLPRHADDEHFVRRDGTQMPIEYSTHALKRDGAIVGAVVMFQDITARKELEQRSKHFEAIVQSSDDAIVSKALDGTITSWNRGAERIYGYTAQEMIGQSIDRVVPTELQEEEARILARVALGEKIEHFETERQHKNGARIFISATISPILDGQGQVVGASKIARDITEKKGQERELEAYRNRLEELVRVRTAELEQARVAAEAANRAKSVFLANMSHEIRTPMNAIIGFTHLLQHELVDHRQLDRLQKITLSAKHLLGVINDILDLSKIEADRLTLENTPFFVGATLDHVRSMMSARVASKDLAFVEDYAPEVVKLAVIGDPLRLGQILVNYISNAVKFTERGSITVHARLVGEDETWVELRFEVVDTGIGIDAEQQARLFEAFEQAEASTTRKHGGTGLGLAISRRLAALMGGTTGVVSAPGAGSTFWVTVRLRKGDARATLQAPVVDHRKLRPNARVLLAEDNEVNQEVARELLVEAGLAVTVVGDGRQALERLEAEPYDLVLMDMQMPVMDGLEATRRIRATPHGATVPILAMTANAFAEDRDLCFAAGMNDHLSKPVEPSRLYAVLARWLPAGEAPAGDGAQAAVAVRPDILLDVQVGLRNVAGKTESFHRLLARFAESHLGDGERLRNALLLEDLDQARILAHTLKGVAATLGAQRVATLAGELESHLRQARDPAVLMGDVDGLIEALVATGVAIRGVAFSDAAPTLESMSPPQLRVALDSFAAMLAEDDLNAVQAWRTLQPVLRARHASPTLFEIDRAMKSFDLPQALERLRALRDEAPFAHDTAAG